MGSAQPRDWVLCAVPTLVQSTVREGAGHVVYSRLSKGCGAGGNFTKKMGTELRGVGGGGPMSRSCDCVIARGDCLRDMSILETECLHLLGRRQPRGLVQAEGLWETVRCVEVGASGN